METTASTTNATKIPDYPYSPVNGWVFYGILHYAEQRIQKQIQDNCPFASLEGLRLVLDFAPSGQGKYSKLLSWLLRLFRDSDPGQQEYVMQFGVEIGENDPGSVDPGLLGKDFVQDLFGEVGTLFQKNITKKGEIILLRLDIVLQNVNRTVDSPPPAYLPVPTPEPVPTPPLPDVPSGRHTRWISSSRCKRCEKSGTLTFQQLNNNNWECLGTPCGCQPIWVRSTPPTPHEPHYI